MPLFTNPIGELVMNSVIVLPTQPTCAMTVSVESVPNKNEEEEIFHFC